MEGVGGGNAAFLAVGDGEDQDLADILASEDEDPLLAAILLGDEEALQEALLDTTVEDQGDGDSTISSQIEAEVEQEPPGRGHRGPRRSRSHRDPFQSMFWRDYIAVAESVSPGDVNFDETLWNEESLIGTAFRRRFSVPYALFNDICTQWKQTGEYRKPFDLVGRPSIPAKLLILGCLRVLSKGTTYDLIDEATHVSYQTVHSFFNKFISWFVAEYYDKLISMPMTDDEIAHVEGHYRSLGLPGCIGSVDCVHVGWDMCPVSHRNDCDGKEGYPTLAFQVIVSHTRKILSVSQEFFGTWNDKTISKFDRTVQAVRHDDVYKNYEWHYFDAQGNTRREKGMYMICDGGYCKWKVLIPPFKHQADTTDLGKWSNHIESLRKDVECTFGILKKRCALIKNRIRLHHKEDIALIFKACCILHNMLHQWDGYDNWDSVREESRRLEESSRALGGRMTMRQREFNPVVEEHYHDDEVEDDFDKRRQILINHYLYRRGRGDNLNEDR